MISKFKGYRSAIYDKVKNDTVEKLGGSVARNNELNSLRKDHYNVFYDDNRHHAANDAKHEAKMIKAGATRKEILINKIADNKAKLAVMDHDAKKHASGISRLKRLGLIAAPVVASTALAGYAARHARRKGYGSALTIIAPAYMGTLGATLGAVAMKRRTEHMRNPHSTSAYEAHNRLRNKLMLAEHELKNMK